MTISNPTEQLADLWRSGVTQLRDSIPKDELIYLVQHTQLDLHHRQYCEAVNWTRLGGGYLRLHLHESIFDWYTPEKDEIALFAAAMTNLWHRQDLFWVHNQLSDTQLSLCRLVGCSPTDTSSPSERWRIMAAQGITRDTSAFPTECRVCHRFVNSDEPDSRCHGICRMYVKSVIIPQLKEAQGANAE
jgi:hypothetical protein